MLHGKKIVCVIPARLASSRFPKKILISLCDKPLLMWVWEAANSVKFFDEVAFAIDDEETADLIQGFGAKYFMTPSDLASGTDRLVYLQKRGLLNGDIWVNWQADEPFISQRMVEDLLQGIEASDCNVWTLKKHITEEKEIRDPHIAKVVCDKNGHALYFSRCAIPGVRDNLDFDKNLYYKHIGMYAYSAKSLKQLETLPVCDYERVEKLEQLRYLYNGMKVRVNETHELAFGIDLPEHKDIAEQIIINKYATLETSEIQ